MREKRYSRRDFLKLASQTGAGLLLTGCIGKTEIPVGKTEIPEGEEYSVENLVMNFGEFGTYKSVYDSEKEMWTLGFWKENMIHPGSKDLSDLKKDGGRIVFQMPFNGVINNSAGEIYVNGEEWNLGNPAISSNEDPRITQGDEIEVRYEANNDSAGFQLWFEE